MELTFQKGQKDNKQGQAENHLCRACLQRGAKNHHLLVQKSKVCAHHKTRRPFCDRKNNDNSQLLPKPCRRPTSPSHLKLFPDWPSHCYPGNARAGSRAARVASRCILGVVVHSRNAQAQEWRRGTQEQSLAGIAVFQELTRFKGLGKSGGGSFGRLLTLGGKAALRERLWDRETWFGNGVCRPPVSCRSEVDCDSPQVESVGRRTSHVIYLHTGVCILEKML